MYCFLLWLSSDLGGVWLYRMHGGKAAFSACPGSVAPYFGSMSLGIYVVGLFTCFLRGLLRTGALFLFLGGSKGAVLDPPNEMFFAVAELGFRWCLAVSHAWRKSCVFGLSRLGCGMFWIYVSTYIRRGALFLFLGGSKGAVLDPPNEMFFAVAELGFRWCLAVSHAWRKSCVFGLSKLGCGMFWIYVSTYIRRGALFLFLGIPKVPFWTRRMYCFLLWLSSDLDGVWLFRMHGGKAAFSACPG